MITHIRIKPFRFESKAAARVITTVSLVLFAAPVFCAETLEDAWKIALTESRARQAAERKVDASQFRREAATQARVPKIHGSSSYTTTSERVVADVDVSSMTGVSGTYLETPVLDKNFGTASVAVTAPIYLGGKIAALEEAADHSTRAAAFEREETIKTLKYDVARAYFTVLLAEKLDEIARANQKALEARETDAQNLVDQGLATQAALLSVKVALADAEQNVYESECQLETARAAYNRLLWRPLDSTVELEEIDLPELVETLDETTAAALRRRPEIARISALARALNAKSREARSERLPQVVAAASYGYAQNEVVRTNDVAQATVGMTWTPFDGVSRAKERSIQSEAIALEKTREEVENAVRLQVRKAWNDATAARRKITVALAARDQADENQRLVAEQFNEGIATYAETLDSQALWTKAHSNLCGAYYNALLARFALDFASGAL